MRAIQTCRFNRSKSNISNYDCYYIYFSHYFIKFIGFILIYYAININIVSLCIVFSYLYLESIDLL